MKKQVLKTATLFALVCVSLSVNAQNIVGYYPLNGNGNDASGNGKNGTVTNANATVDRNNNNSAAMSFNGSTSKIEVTDTTGFGNGNGSISVAAWFKNASPSGINPIITTGMQGFASGIYLCSNYLNATGKIVFALASSASGFPTGVAGSIFIQSDASTYNDNNWHHVAVVVDKTANIATMYIDGVKSKILKYNSFGVTGGTLQNNDTELNISGLTNSSKPSQAYIGIGAASGANQLWNGSLDEIYYLKRTLTATEISNLYNGSSLNVSKLEKNHSIVNVCPNPANHSIQIKGIDFTEDVRVKISSMDGKLLKEEISNQSLISISDLNTGMYFIELTDAKGKTSVTKFIKE